MPGNSRTVSTFTGRLRTLAAVAVTSSFLTACGGYPGAGVDHSSPGISESGPAPVTKNIRVPDLAGLTEVQAKALSRSKGLQLETTISRSALVPAGHVVSQSPAARDLVSSGETIVVTVSKPPQPLVQPPTILNQPSLVKPPPVGKPSTPARPSLSPTLPSHALAHISKHRASKP